MCNACKIVFSRITLNKTFKKVTSECNMVGHVSNTNDGTRVLLHFMQSFRQTSESFQLIYIMFSHFMIIYAFMHECKSRNYRFFNHKTAKNYLLFTNGTASDSAFFFVTSNFQVIVKTIR